jgi:hypothetical protein
MSDIQRADAATTPDTYRETSVVDLPRNLEQIIAIAKVMAASGFYPDAKTAQQAAALMILGVQFGIPPAQSLTAIHIVKGKPMLHYSALLSKIRQHPDYDYKITESTDKKAAIEFYRHGEPCGVSEFTLEQARKQGTQNMDKFPDTMLLARAVSNGVKRYCPDVLNGMPVYTPGEIDQDAAVYTDAARSTKGDALRAEMVAQAGPEAITTEGIDVPDETPYEPYMGPTVSDEQEALL